MGLPLGIPPGPEDAAIARAAPEKCLLYVNWTGTASPDPNGRSEMERLLAEPEVQLFLKAIGNWIRSTVHQSSPKAKQDGADSASVAVDLLGIAMTHPTAFFVADARPRSGKPAGAKAPAANTADLKVAGAEAAPPNDPLASLAEVDVHAGLIVSLGADASRVRGLLEGFIKADNGQQIERFQLAGQTWYCDKAEKGKKGLPAVFGFQGGYFIAAVGDGSLEGILARLNKQPPAWYAAALKQVPVPRRTGIIYLNIREFRESLLKAIESQAGGDEGLRHAKAVFEVLGLDHTTALVSTTGLDDNGMVNKVLMALDGKPQGLLQLVSERPLQPADLAPIPRDATLALALRLDLQKVLDLVLSATERTNPVARAEAAQAIARFERVLGIDLCRFLGALGDTWCIYNSPGEGGLVFTGLTAVVPIRDAGVLSIGYAKLLGAAKQLLPADRNASSESGVGRMQQFRFGRYEVNYVNLQSFSPAWCVTERQVILALNVHNIKAYLARRAHQPLSVVPEVAQALGAAEGATMLLYSDTPKLFELAYPVVSVAVQAFAAPLQKPQGEADLEFWPSAPSIRSHLRPDVSTVQRTPDGVQITCHYCLPTGGVTGPLLLLLPMSAPGWMPLDWRDPQRLPPAEPVRPATTTTPPPFGPEPTSSKPNSPPTPATPYSGRSR